MASRPPSSVAWLPVAAVLTAAGSSLKFTVLASKNDAEARYGLLRKLRKNS
jgi:hypothetical protein